MVLVTRSIFPPNVGDVVFFNPPSELDEVIANSKIGRAAATAAAASSSDVSSVMSMDPVDSSTKVTIVPTKGKQFLKRVVGIPGEKVGVWNFNPFVILQCRKDESNDAETRICTYRVVKTGEYSRPDIFPEESWNRATTAAATSSTTSILAKDEYFVAGDNGYRSVDSRVWGPLKRKYLFGTAQWVIYPMEHFGRIRSGPLFLEQKEVKIGQDFDSGGANMKNNGLWSVWEN